MILFHIAVKIFFSSFTCGAWRRIQNKTKYQNKNLISSGEKKLHEKEHNGVTALEKDAHEDQEHHVY